MMKSLFQTRKFDVTKAGLRQGNIMLQIAWLKQGNLTSLWLSVQLRFISSSCVTASASINKTKRTDIMALQNRMGVGYCRYSGKVSRLVGLSVGRSICRSVGRSVSRSVDRSFFQIIHVPSRFRYGRAIARPCV